MRTHESRLAAACSQHHGIVTMAQAHRLGLTNREIIGRLASGLLVPMHEGVYRHAAAPLTPSGRLLAAVLACGPSAVASHRSAARHHGLRGVYTSQPEVTVARTSLPLRTGVTCHRSGLLDGHDVSSVNRIPVTTIPRTLLDLGAVVPFEVVELAAQDAVVGNLVSIVDLVCVLERVGKRGRRGSAALRAVVRASLPTSGVASRLELDLLALVRMCPVPEPVLQYEVEVPGGKRFRLDAAWPHMRIGIDADGRRWHATRGEFERDLARSRAITAAGWQHLRYGWADVHERPLALQAELTAVLTRARAA